MKLAKLNLLLLAFVVLVLVWAQFFGKDKAKVLSDSAASPSSGEAAFALPPPNTVPDSAAVSEIPFEAPPPAKESAPPAALVMPTADRPEAERINYFQSINRVLKEELEKNSFSKQESRVIMRNLAKEFNLAGNPNNPTNLERAQTESVRELKLDEERSSALGDAILESLKKPMETVTIPQFRNCIQTRAQNLSSCSQELAQDFVSEVAARSENDNFWITPALNELARASSAKLVSECQEPESTAALLFEMHVGTCRPL